LRLCLGNAQDAADFAHGTFVRVFAWRSAEALREQCCYLSASVRALMSDSFRRCATEQAYLDSLAARPEPLDIPAQTRLSILETLTAIDLALDGMGERTRQVFLAVQLEGLTYRSAGERLGVSMTTVENHMVRAMTRCLLLCKD
ncbi:sigma factor-like helix-turn-helix DNA-binding protein, partial [Pseudomonas aeruginosa]